MGGGESDDTLLYLMATSSVQSIKVGLLRQKALQLFCCRQASARAQLAAFERGHSVRGVHRLFQAQPLHQTVNKSGAKGIARARRIAANRRTKGGRGNELIFDVSERAA